MKRTLIQHLYRLCLSYRQTLPILIFTLISLSVKSQCPPTIFATPDPAIICAGDSVRMVCTDAGATSWQWYKDGIIMPDETNDTCYAFEGADYMVMTGGCAFTSNPIKVTLKPFPAMSISCSTNIICNGQQDTLFVSTGPNVVWVWISPGSLIGSTINPLPVTLYNTETFQIVGSDQTTRCVNTTAITIQVYPLLTPGIIYSNSQVCPGETPPLITSNQPSGGSGAYLYQWQKSIISPTTGFSNIADSTRTSYQPGPTTQTTWYRLVISSQPCDDKTSNAVVVQVNTNPSVTSPASKAICTGAEVGYHPLSNVTGATYTWTASLTSGSVTGFSVAGIGDINDVLSLPAGTSISGEVTYVITPTGPAPTFCVGTPLSLIVSVHPIPLVANTILSQDICASTYTTPVVLLSNIASATFSWTATGSTGISGYLASGTGDIPSMQIFSSLNVTGSITYTVTPHGPATTCAIGPSVDYIINVNPSPGVTNDPMQQTICTGGTTSEVILSPNIPSTTFTWTATALPSGIFGYQTNGTNTIPAQTITNPTTEQGIITYKITPSGSLNGCAGVARDYLVFVNPEPVALAAPSAVTICSGDITNVALTSNVTNTAFYWTASGPAEVTGFVADSGSSIVQQLFNTSNDLQYVTYVVTPRAEGCQGSAIIVIVTVAPTPSLTTAPLTETICSGAGILINLAGTPSNANFSWTASGSGVTGYSDGTGPIISQTLTNITNTPGEAVYAIVVSANGCTIQAENYTVTINPTPSVTNLPLAVSLCSGEAFNLALTSNVAGTTYTWTVNGTPGMFGFSPGSGGIINQTLLNSTSSQGTVVYTITPTANGCPGTPVDYTVTINPIPDLSLSLTSQAICSENATAVVNFASSVAGTIFTWTATPSGPGITGYTASGSASIPSQTISNSLSAQGTVIYTTTTSFNGCAGSEAIHTVTINPRPIVTNASMSQTMCTGSTSDNVVLLSDVTGTTFSWGATPSSPDITNYKPSGGNSIPPQTIYNSSDVAGTVTYLITPRSNFGPLCIGTTADYVITVNPRPSVVSSLNEAVCSGQPFNYTIISNLAGSSFSWSRDIVSGISNSTGSGATETINETLINTTINDIDVQYILTPKGEGPTFCPGNSETLTVRVRALPQVNAGLDFTIPYGINTALAGYASGGTGLLTYTWTPNSYIGSGANTPAPQTTNLYGTRTFNLTVNDETGCTSSDDMTVFVVGSPIAATPMAAPSGICLGGSSIINANATGGSGVYIYSWTSVPGVFTSAAPTINVSPVVNTEYFVTVSDTYNSATSSVTVIVNPLPLLYVLTGGGSYCIDGPGVAVGLAGSQSGVNYQLYHNGDQIGAVVAGNNGPISFGNQTLAGIYTAVATRISTGCVKAMGSSVTVSINSLPVALAGPDQFIPYGTNTSLNGSVSGGFGLMDYTWIPSVFIASGSNTSAPVTKNLYSNTNFTLIITDANGCVGTDQVLVSLNGNAVNAIASASPDHICADTSLTQLNATITGGTGTYTYSWTCIPAAVPAWTSTLQNPMVSPDVTTIYTVTADDGYNSAIASVSVIVNPLPAPYSVLGGGEYCYGGIGVDIGLSGSELNTNYQLYRGGVMDGSPVTGTGNPLNFGNRTAAFAYTVVATNNNTGCMNLMSDSAIIIITAPPLAFLVTGGGSYPLGGLGRNVGLAHADIGIIYQLNCNNLPVGSPLAGLETALDFGLQTQAGTYTVVATDLASGCSGNMLGSVNISILAIPELFDVTGGGAYCAGGTGLPIGLTGSEIGVNYQLLFNGFALGTLVAGNNTPLSWGLFTNAGIYEVRAINSTYGAMRMMLDSAVITINPLPTLFTISPTGAQCPGTVISLNGSDAGVTYYLQVNGTTIETRQGTGVAGFIDFGPQTMNGTYTVEAVNATTGCQNMMNGSTYINVSLQVFDVIPAGILCPGQEISLSGSETGVNYQLRRNNTFNLGMPVPGTGNAISLGTAGLPGTYSVIAINNATNCVAFMADTATLYPDPTAFTIVPDGPVCEGNAISLNGSDPGVHYVLILDHVINIDTMAGTGSPLNFGTQLTAGSYTIVAIDQTSHCQFNMNGITLMNDSPVKFSVIPAGVQCNGTTVGLSGSQLGNSYQLIYNDVFYMGLPVSGTGNAITFGSQSLNGTYTVRAENDVTGCNCMMNDSAVLMPMPNAFWVTPNGNNCAGTPVQITGSEINFNYVLVLNGVVNIDTIAGTGSIIDFGAQTTPGTYTVLAYNATTLCLAPMSGSTVINAAPVVYSMVPAGFACQGAIVGLVNSETGITYHLRRNEIYIGLPVSGTGSAISFGAQTLSGTYTVIATGTNNCVSAMNGSVVINPKPVAYTVTPAGSNCSNTLVGLNGSETGINYILILNGTIQVDTIAGTGNALSFGAQTTAGIYTVIASNATTLCQNSMTGNSVIKPAPIAYNVNPAGIVCTGSAIGLDNSETGVSYQLRRNGSTNVGAPLAGNGSPVSFGIQTIPGTYTVEAAGNNGCSTVMTGSVVMNTAPTIYTQYPAGSHCRGIEITLNGSENGVSYILYRDGILPVDTLTGNGSVLNFGTPQISGSYTISAFSTVSMCLAPMNGNTILLDSPTAFNVTPAGINCAGSTVGCDGSETGISYQLVRDGNTNAGLPVAGTGSAISFGSINTPGTYTVIGTSTLTGCTTIMSGEAFLQPTPLSYTIAPQGMQCAGTSLTMNGSQIGVSYVLLLDNTFKIDTLAGNGNALNFGAQLITGSYTIEAIGGATFCPAAMTGSTQIMALPTAFNVTPAGLLCSSATIGLDGSETGVNYTLFKDGITTGIVQSGTGLAIVFGTQTAGDYTVIAENQISYCSAFMPGSLQIGSPLSVNAGADITTCENTSITITDASASTTNIIWTSTGTGLLSNPSTLNPTFTPSASDVSGGTVTLTLTATNTGCGSVSDIKVLSFINHTAVNAAPDTTICEGVNPLITGATASAYSTIVWTTSGSGLFTNGNTLTPTYAPSQADILNGSVTLTLSANSIAPCTNVLTAHTLVTIHARPVVSAGNDALICSTETYINSDASALNCAIFTWTTSGSGTFSAANNLANIYTPGISDIANGSVTLTLTTTGNAPCADVSDQKEISFLASPIANAGPSTTICNTCTFVATGASALNATSIHWSTSGSGIFNNPSTLFATYTPSAADYSAGSVILSLAANSNAPCTSIADTMKLSFSNTASVEFTWGPACEGQPVAFNVNPAITNIGAVSSWLWNFGDGSTSTIMNPTHLYASTGAYTVTLSITNLGGNANTVSHTVTLSQLPVAFFTYTNPNCSNQAIVFTNLSHTLYGNISEWVWNYGDGSANDTIQFPDEPNVSHQFSGPGIWNVTLTVTNSFGCKSLVTIPVEVIAAPVTNFVYSNDCSGGETSFMDASSANGAGNTVDYWWNFGDPATGMNNQSNMKDVLHVFSTSGTYQVKHVVRNFNNCADTIVKMVVIRPPVTVDFVYDHTCVAGNANFMADTTVINVSEITNWVWDFGDGVTEFQQNTVHVYAGIGSYEVKLTVTDNAGCTASKTRTIVVNPLPLAMFNVSQLPCQNVAAHFDDVSTTYAGFITKWEWSYGDGNTQTVNFPSNGDVNHTYTLAGTYAVTLTVTSSDSCKAVHTQSIIINPTPIANFEFLSTCQLMPVQFNDLSQTGGTGSISSRNWNFGDPSSAGNNTSTLQNPAHVYASTGTYQVSLTVSTANGCQSTISIPVTIGASPVVDFGYTNHCQNTDIQFTPAATVNIANVVIWNWSFGDGYTSTLPNPQHTYSTSGNFNVTLKITNNQGCENSISHNITILPAPVANFNTNATACAQHQVNFINQSYAPAGYIMRWTYHFGDGNSTVINFPGNPNVSHTYANYGNFTVTLTVITNDSCSSTTSLNLQVLQSPLANFDYDVTCAGAPIQFADLSQGTLASWLWNFGEPGAGPGNASSQQNPVHTYQQPGNYQVNFLVSNVNGCTDTVSRTISITPKPTVDFSFNNGCAADTVNFNSSDFVNATTTATWLWQFGDNSTSIETDPDHIFIVPETYNVSLTITDQNGCSNLKIRQVVISSAPIAFFNGNTPSCSGVAVLFNDNSSTLNGIINTWYWEFGDGTTATVLAPANPDVSHAYTAAGIYDVTLTIHTSTGCEAYYTTSITINDASVTAFSFAGSCSGLLTSFNDLTQTAGGNLTAGWSWQFGDPNSGINNSSNLPNPEHLFSGPGTYTATLTTGNTVGCLSSATQTIVITPQPAVDFLSSQSCDGTPVTFSADVTVTDILDIASYLWDFGDGTGPSSQASPEHLYAEPGNYTVTLSIVNLSGCGNSVSNLLTVHTLPVAQFTSTGNCAANLMHFNDISFNPGGEAIVGWSWDFGDSTVPADTSSLQNPSYTYSTAGTHNVTLTITTASGCSESVVMPVTVIPSPEAQFSYVAEPCHNGSVLFHDESLSNQSTISAWYWEFGSGDYSTLVNPVHVFGNSDTCYNVKLVVTNANGCSDTLIKEVCIPSGLNVTLNYTATCFGETTWFIPTLEQPVGGTITFYNWDFGDPITGLNNTSKLSNPQHTFTKPGTFVVSLLAIDANNCSTTSYITITISPLPKASFGHTGGICGNIVSFTDMTTEASIVRWTWFYGDGTSEIINAPENPNVNHDYPFPGIYEITLITQSEAGCSDTITKSIRRTPCISSEFTQSNATVCQKRTMRFTETSTCQAPISSWSWNFGDNTSVTFTTLQPYIDHTYSKAGTYLVKMVVATQMVGGMVTDTSSRLVVVQPAAIAAYKWQDECIGSKVAFENMSLPNSTIIKSYLWNFGDPGTASDTTSVKHPEYKYDHFGQYDVKLVVTNTLGCTDTLVNTVNIFENPKADFVWNSSCEFRPVFFTDNSDTTSSAIVKWNWLFINAGEVMGASTNAASSYSFGHAGIYDAVLRITDRNGCHDSTSKQVAINSSPVAKFSISDEKTDRQGEILMANETVNGTHYAWDFGNGTTSTALNPVVSFDQEGRYEIQLITWNDQNCSDTTTLKYELMYKGLFVPTAFNPGNLDPQVAVFLPKGINLKSYQIGIFDRMGNLVWSSTKLDNTGSPAESWDGILHGKLLKQGVYLWKISAQFRDGENWDGESVGKTENMPQEKTGTVTLIR